MSNPYSRILKLPGAGKFCSAGLLARFPMAMTGIGIVLMVQHLYGSYGLAGSVSAAAVITIAIAAPFISRLVDQYGQSRIMRPALVVYNLGLAALVIAAVSHAPAVVLFVCAIIAGLSCGSMGALVRARWSLVITSPRDLHTAYALESAVDEVVFVIGPILATVLATVVASPAAIIASIVVSLGGGFWFLSLRESEPAPAQTGPIRLRPQRAAAEPTAVPAEAVPDDSGIPNIPVMRIPAMWAVILVIFCVGFLFGGTDVPTIAVAKQLGYESWAGVVLGCFALGSLISGLIYGVRTWTSSLEWRFVIGVIALGIGSSLFLFISTLPVLAAVMFLTGFAIAPTFVNANAVVQQVVHPSRLTEGLTWTATANSAGFSIGSSVSGIVIDMWGPHSGFAIAIAGAVLASIVALASINVITTALAPARARAAAAWQG